MVKSDNNKKDLATNEATKIPLWLKLIFTILFSVTIPSNIIHYSAINQLWFCDIAIITTFFGLWFESSLLISSKIVKTTVFMVTGNDFSVINKIYTEFLS